MTRHSGSWPPAPTGLANRQRRSWLAGLGLAGVAGLGGCAGLRPADEPLPDEPAIAPAQQVKPFSSALTGASPAGWRPYALRRDVRQTRYAVARDDQRQVLHALAASSATGLRCAVQIDPDAFGQLSFSWRVREAPARANVAQAALDDCPARLIVAFDGDSSRLPLRDRLFYEQVELFTGQRLPYATLMYVWDGGHHALESVHANHRSSRIQYLTVESGAQRAGRWLHYQRDVVADYRRVFGEAPGSIIGVGVLTDADALKTQLEAWYGDISLAARPPTPASTG